MRKVLLTIGVVAFVTTGAGACATKKFVRTTVGEVNDKVTTLSKSVEENQERTRQNEQKIGEVDQRVGQVDQRVTTVADESKAGIEKVNARAEEIERSTKRLVYEVVISEDEGNFKFAKTDLPDEAKGELDTLVQKLKADPQGAYIEIEGHTDNVGPADVNKRIGLERAEEVKRYLYEQHQVPLHKMNVISYGEEKPIAPNKTRDGRAQNRRVVIKVLT
jgi:outer membrane protein OmpA-like peptidoglycan-associated protein